jgi:glycosyltransferase 2 family protein
LAVLIALYLATLPDLLDIVSEPVQQRILVLVLAGAIAGLVAFCMVDRLPFGVRRLRAIAPLADLSIEMRRLLLTRSRRSATIFALTVIGTLLNIVSMDLTGRCVGIDLAFARWLTITPPVAIFQLLPLSLGGWGVREAALVILLGTLGIPGEMALAASLCIGLSQIVVGLPGGLIWLNNWDVRSGVARSTVTGDLTTRLKQVLAPK